MISIPSLTRGPADFVATSLAWTLSSSTSALWDTGCSTAICVATSPDSGSVTGASERCSADSRALFKLRSTSSQRGADPESCGSSKAFMLPSPAASAVCESATGAVEAACVPSNAAIVPAIRPSKDSVGGATPARRLWRRLLMTPPWASAGSGCPRRTLCAFWLPPRERISGRSSSNPGKTSRSCSS